LISPSSAGTIRRRRKETEDFENRRKTHRKKQLFCEKISCIPKRPVVLYFSIPHSSGRPVGADHRLAGRMMGLEVQTKNKRRNEKPWQIRTSYP
jgi:hypothetical protein